MNDIIGIGIKNMVSSLPIAIRPQAPTGTLLSTFYACSRFWFMFYGVCLIFHDIFFTIFPTTLLVISVFTLILHYTKIRQPPPPYVNSLFGENPWITTPVETDESSSSGLGQFGMALAVQALQGFGGLSYVTSLVSRIFGALPFSSAVTSFNLNSAATAMGMAQSNPESLVSQVVNNEQVQRYARQVEERIQNYNPIVQTPRQSKKSKQVQNQSDSPDNKKGQRSTVQPDRKTTREFFTPSATPTGRRAVERILTIPTIGTLSSASNNNNNSGPSVPIIAHQGAGFDAPENSLMSFLHSKAQGCTFVHFDIKLSKDRVALLFHDQDLHRIAGIPKKFKYVNSYDLRTIDISLHHHNGQNFRGARIPTFEEAVEACLKLNLKFFINVVDSNEYMVNTVVSMYRRYQAMYTMAIVTSFHFKVIHDIRRKDNKIMGCIQFPYTHHRIQGTEGLPLGQHTRSFILHFFHEIWDIFHDWIIANFFWWYLGLSAVLVEKDIISKKDVIEWGKKGIRVFVWPVNNPVEKVYFNKVMSVGYLTDTFDGDFITQKNSSATKDVNNNHNHKSNPKMSHSKKEMESIAPSPHLSDANLVKTTLNKAAYNLQGLVKEHGSGTDDTDSFTTSSDEEKLQRLVGFGRVGELNSQKTGNRKDDSSTDNSSSDSSGNSSFSDATSNDNSSTESSHPENYRKSSRPQNVYTRRSL